MAPRKEKVGKTPKKATPQKPKQPKEKTKNSRGFKAKRETISKCTEWLQRQKKIPPTEMIVVDEPLVEQEDDDTPHENPADFDVPFRELVRKNVEVQVMYECEWDQCKEEFKTEMEHMKHIEIHVRAVRSLATTEELVCKWDLCDYDTEDQVSLIRHLYLHGYHSRIKTAGATFCASTKVPICKMDSKQRNMIDDVKANFFCYWHDCDESFLNVQDFYHHVAIHISDEFFDRKRQKEVQCKWRGQCTKKYIKKAHMTHHVVSHTNQKVIACSNCGTRFCNKYRLVDHLRHQLEGTVAHQCPECGKCFPVEKALRSHMKCHINCFKCNLCDMTCITNMHLVTHIRYRHFKGRPFQCDLCDYRAVTKRDLEVHINVHDPNFFFRCTVVPGCNFACKAISTLKRHVASHEGVTKIFKCHICRKEYQFGHKLSKHLINQHDFQHPSGFKRFQYKQDEDGFYRLQLTRLESLEVSEQIVNQDEATQASPFHVEPVDEAGVKRIEDFDMMRKYLRIEKTNKITVEVMDQDASGRSIKKKTFMVRELVAE